MARRLGTHAVFAGSGAAARVLKGLSAFVDPRIIPVLQTITAETMPRCYGLVPITNLEREARHLLQHEASGWVVSFDYIPGETLRDWLRNNPSADEHVRLQLAEDLIDAWIATAHALQLAASTAVIHGDLKPENIVVGSDDRLSFIDFASAMLAASPAHKPDEAHLLTGRRSATLRYVDPDVLAGETASEHDLYSLMIVAMEVLAGKHPDDLDRCGRATIEQSVSSLLRRIDRAELRPLPVDTHTAVVCPVMNESTSRALHHSLKDNLQ